MRNLCKLVGYAILFAAPCQVPASGAAESSNLYYQFTLTLEGTRLDNLSLGDDPDADRLDTERYEFELDLEYSPTDQAYLFLDVSLFDESESVEPDGEHESESGLERKQMGVAVNFGEEVPSEFKLGRIAFVSASDWWLWWDEELDAISMESSYGRFSGMLVVAEEQAPTTTAVDYIDPEMKDVRRVIASLNWEFTDEQLLVLYYLDQTDRSSSLAEGDVVDDEDLDPVDADLTWSGISYLGGLESDSLGKVDIEMHYSEVRGHQTLTGFKDLSKDLFEVDQIERQRVSGSAQSFLLAWTPARLDDWTFSLGAARGSGDDNPDDGRDESFQQTGLQGDSNVYGELYQPEISNMTVQALGVSWKLAPGYELQLFGFDYQQLEASDEIRDVSIELDPNGVDRDLGREIDLVLLVEAISNFQITLIAAEFEAGAAYGDREGERSRYVSLELDYSF